MGQPTEPIWLALIVGLTITPLPPSLSSRIYQIGTHPNGRLTLAHCSISATKTAIATSQSSPWWAEDDTITPFKTCFLYLIWAQTCLASVLQRKKAST